MCTACEYVRTPASPGLAHAAGRGQPCGVTHALDTLQGLDGLTLDGKRTQSVAAAQPSITPIKVQAEEPTSKEEDDVVTPLQRGHHHKQRSSDAAARQFASLEASWQPDAAGMQQQPPAGQGQTTMTICSTFSITATMVGTNMQGSPGHVITAADM